MNNYRVLFAVTGLTPQVVTETLYVLHRRSDKLPVAIQILKTAEGYQRAKLNLINDGWRAGFYVDYRLPLPDYSEQNIHVLRQTDGSPLIDIRTHPDNQATL